VRLSLLLAAGLCSFPALGQSGPEELPFQVECKLGVFVDATSTLCREPRWSRGDDRVTALSATSADADNGGTVWQLTDALRVTFGSAELIADSGVFELDSDRNLIRARILGEPVTWTDFNEDNDTSFSGSAEAIEIDNETTTFRLLGRTVLSRRTGERAPDDYEGCDWIYNWTDHTLDGTQGGCGVRLVITPPQDDQNAEPASGPR